MKRIVPSLAMAVIALALTIGISLTFSTYVGKAQNLVTQTTAVPGYAYGSPKLQHSPVSLDELDKLKQSVLFSQEDEKYLHMAGEILVPQTKEILDVWYGFVASHPFLVYYFSHKTDGKPNADYLNRVRTRFGQWIKDTTDAKFDRVWLDYQYEIGVRHHRTGKNRTDKADSVAQVNSRYIPAFIVPISLTIEPFLSQTGASADDVKKMMVAWNKSVTLQATLWSYPYIKQGEF